MIAVKRLAGRLRQGEGWARLRQPLWILLAFALPFVGLPFAPGPAGVPRWEPIVALSAPGAVRRVVSSQSAVYAVVEGWGVFRSEDGGLSWEPANRLPRGRLGRVEVSTLATSPTTPQLLLASMATPGTDSWPAIYKTNNGGRSWVPRRGLGATDVEALAVAPGDVVYAASGQRLFRSPDGGDTWLEAGKRPTASSVVAMAVDGTLGTLYAGTEGDGLWFTADRGASWSAALPGRTVYAVAAAEGGRIYAGADDGLYYSANRGASWQLLPPPDSGPVVALAVSPQRLFAAVAGQPVRYSRDGGATWTALQPLPVEAAVTAMALCPQPAGHLYVGSSEGLWRLHEATPAEAAR